MDHWLVLTVFSICALLAFVMYCKSVRTANEIEARSTAGEPRRRTIPTSPRGPLDNVIQALDRWIDKQAADEATPVRVQMSAFAVAVPFALLFRTTYYPILVALYALAIIVAIVAGFLLRPLRDTFVVQTTVLSSSSVPARAVRHEQIALRIDITRLWLLFFPTFAALAFFVVASVNGLTWWDSIAYPLVFVAQVIVLNVVSTWVIERSVLRDAIACFADYVAEKRNLLRYGFKDEMGGYYGSTALRLARVDTPEMRGVVVYKVCNPDSNKIAGAFVFHRFTIVGRGLPEFDGSVASEQSVPRQIVPETL